MDKFARIFTSRVNYSETSFSNEVDEHHDIGGNVSRVNEKY